MPERLFRAVRCKKFAFERLGREAAQAIIKADINASVRVAESAGIP